MRWPWWDLDSGCRLCAKIACESVNCQPHADAQTAHVARPGGQPAFLRHQTRCQSRPCNLWTRKLHSTTERIGNIHRNMNNCGTVVVISEVSANFPSVPIVQSSPENYKRDGHVCNDFPENYIIPILESGELLGTANLHKTEKVGLICNK